MLCWRFTSINKIDELFSKDVKVFIHLTLYWEGLEVAQIKLIRVTVLTLILLIIAFRLWLLVFFGVVKVRLCQFTPWFHSMSNISTQITFFPKSLVQNYFEGNWTFLKLVFSSEKVWVTTVCFFSALNAARWKRKPRWGQDWIN